MIASFWAELTKKFLGYLRTFEKLGNKNFPDVLLVFFESCFYIDIHIRLVWGMHIEMKHLRDVEVVQRRRWGARKTII